MLQLIFNIFAIDLRIKAKTEAKIRIYKIAGKKIKIQIFLIKALVSFFLLIEKRL